MDTEKNIVVPTAGTTVALLTLGCRVNQYESEAIEEELKRRGYTVLPSSEKCDAYIINTCTVTAEAARKSRQLIRRLRDRSAGAIVIAAGCLAQQSPSTLAEISGVDAVVGNRKKLDVVDKLDELIESGKKNTPLISVPPLDDAKFEHMTISAFSRTRVYVKIEDGCENRCAYCAIPDARGPVRSKSADDVISEVIGLVKSGNREIVLTGIETASYGRDLDGDTLEGLLEALDKRPEISENEVRIRLGSMEPSVFRADFVNRISKLNSLAPHFHLSLQSGCSKTLAAMRRKYTAEKASEIMSRLRAAIPGVQFTCDIIAGFPGETEEDFSATLDFIKNAGLLAAHIFPYSQREGTPAATMPGQLTSDIKHKRAAILSDAESKVRLDILKQAVDSKKTLRVLFETFDGSSSFGHSDSYIPFMVPSSNDLHGQFRDVLPTGICELPSSEFGSCLEGIIVK